MFEIECSFVGCGKVVKSEFPMSKNAAYICVQHSEKLPEQRDRPRFQIWQFDPDLPRGDRH